jgi:hypothetical protein
MPLKGPPSPFESTCLLHTHSPGGDLIRTSLGKEGGGGETLAKTDMGEKFRILGSLLRTVDPKALWRAESAKEVGPVERDQWQSKFLYTWRSQFVEMIEI